MKKVFICSPLRGNIQENQAKAKKYARQAILKGYIPIVPHIYFTEFLNEDNAIERQLGIQAGIELMSMCDELWVYGKPTKGMKQEISAWGKLKLIRYKWLTLMVQGMV